VLLLGLAGCDAGGAATAVPPTEPPTAIIAPTVADTPTAPGAAEATPGGPAIDAQLYDYAPDYRWIAGQLRQEGACWIVTYISPLTAHAPDQYNNQMTLLAGGWNPTDFSPGAWVIVQGQPQAGTDVAPGCLAHGYEVTGVRLNPKTPKASDS
jgi:hypothetical protein